MGNDVTSRQVELNFFLSLIRVVYEKIEKDFLYHLMVIVSNCAHDDRFGD